MKTKLKPFLILNEHGPVLLQLLQQLREQPMPLVVAFHLNAFYREALSHAQNGMEARNAAIRRHGRDGVIEPGTPAMESFLKELNELAEQEVDLALPAKLRLPPSVMLKPADWDVLEAFFELESQ